MCHRLEVWSVTTHSRDVASRSPLLAEKLLAHLERELTVRGARGGPLTALVGQLNHEVTHLQVRQTRNRNERRHDSVVACSLLDAANRLDPTFVTVEEVEGLARLDNFSLHSSSAVLMWGWAISFPGCVPVPLLGRLTQPSREDWYVHATPRHAAARTGVKQLLLTRRADRAIFDRMAASQDGDDRSYAAADLLEVARVDPRVVPIDLARRLAHDHDKAVAKRGVELLRLLEGLKPSERMRVHGMFGM